MLRMNMRLLAPLAILAIGGCVSTGHLNTTSGHPEIALTHHSWKDASLAIALYSLSKGRELDQVRPGHMVLYEAVPSSDGTLQVVSKMIYALEERNDSLIISSHRYLTADLDDDDSASEASDQPSLDAQQKELEEIARILTDPLTAKDAGHQ